MQSLKQTDTTKQLPTLIFTILFYLSGSSQVVQNQVVKSDTVLYEKLYLHIEREIYSPGDIVWFKTYLVSGINHQPIPGFKNVYVELISEDGKVIDRRLMLSINGVSNNDFHLPGTLATGQYTIRGYTKYLLNFGEESLFHQKIAVSRTTDMPGYKEKTEEQLPIDVSFLPEGGNLVLNAVNYVAFKATDETGKGIKVTGKIVDETGQEVTSFESRFKGMGIVVFMPQEGKNYYAQIDGHSDFKYPFEDALPDGVAIHYRQNDTNLQFILSRNFKANNDRKLTLTATCKGYELFREEVKMSGFQHPVNIYKGFFPHGISKITLHDEHYNIMAERLVFVRNADEKTLTITTDKKEYQSRDIIELEIESLLGTGEDSIVTGLSVAVVNEAYFSEGGRTQTIESYLLLDSELKGPLESPASFFTEDENFTSDEKLDLVMMVNGWRRYYWDELLSLFEKPLPGWNDTGLTITGKLTNYGGGKPVVGGMVELGPFSGEFLILKDTTDEAGRFTYKRLYLKDSAQVMINAFNEKGRRSVEIFYEPTSLFDTVVPFEEIIRAARNIELHELHNRTSFNRHLAEREFELETGSILLGEVDVIEKYTSGAVITGKHGFRDREFILSGKDKKEYSTIVKYLEFEALGLFVDEKDLIKIGLAKMYPIFYVDDLKVEDFDYIKNLPVDEIVKVEIYNPQILIGILDDTLMGVPKDGGAISILTKNRYGTFPHKFVRNISGRIIVLVSGFNQVREFYAPVYPLREQDASEKTDYRPTLFWQPYAHLERNKANIEFHASDIPGRYVIVAEGISAKGKIVSSISVVQVAD